MKWFLIFLLMMLLTRPSFGQGFNPYAQPVNNSDPRSQRARREQAVAFVPSARSLVEAYGDDGCYAIFACSPAVGKRLATWHQSGDLERQIPKPREFLKIIGQPCAGDEVVLFAMQNDLSNLDTCIAFLECPLQYTLRLKTLEVGAAEVRARRLHAEAAQVPPAAVATEPNTRTLAIGGGVLGLIVLAVWWRRRQPTDTTSRLNPCCHCSRSSVMCATFTLPIRQRLTLPAPSSPMRPA